MEGRDKLEGTLEEDLHLSPFERFQLTRGMDSLSGEEGVWLCVACGRGVV